MTMNKNSHLHKPLVPQCIGSWELSIIFRQLTLKIRGKNLLTFVELTEQKIHNLHSRTVNTHSLSGDNTCTAQHSHTTVLNIENRKIKTNKNKLVWAIVGIFSPATSSVFSFLSHWHVCMIVAFKGARSRLNGLKSLAKLFNFVVFQSVSIFSILNHPCSFMLCYNLFGVFLSLQSIIFRFPSIQQ